jgi:hypothetical protein
MLKVRLERYRLHLIVEITSGSSNGVTVNVGNSKSQTVVVPLPPVSAGGVPPVGNPPRQK